MGRPGKLLCILLLLGALASAAGLLGHAFVASARGDENDKGVLAGLISRALSSPGMRVSIGAVDGALSSDATIRDIVLSDTDGPWLKIDRIRLQWTRSALLLRRLEVDRLDIGHIEFTRRPLPSAAQDQGAPLLPTLPVKVVVREFALDDLALGEPLLGAVAHLSANGHASLGDPAQGLDLVFEAARTDAPGAFQASLSFAPSSAALKIKLLAHEPKGGLLARAFALPGTPAVNINLDGAGTLEAFAAKLSFAAGPELSAEGSLDLVRSGPARKARLALAARLGGALPKGLLPLFGGQSRLDVAATLGADRSVILESATLATRGAELDASGRVDPAGALDLRANLRGLAAPESPYHARRFEVDAKATGTLAAPQIAATLDLADAQSPAGGLDSLNGVVTAQAAGGPGSAAFRTTFTAQGAAAGLHLADERLVSALGAHLAFDLRGDLGPHASPALTVAKLTADHAAVDFAGRAGWREAQGALRLRIDDLATLDGFFGRAVAGSLEAKVILSGGAAEKGTLAGKIEAEWDRPKTGIAALDGVMGGKLAVTGGLAQSGLRGLAFSDLRLTGDDVNVRIDGRAAREGAALNVSLGVPDLARADPRLSGSAKAEAKVTGSPERRAATAHITLTAARALGRAIPSLTLELSGEAAGETASGAATLAGVVGGRLTQGRMELARLPAGGWRLAPLSLAVGASRVYGELTWSQGLAAGALRVSSSDLDDFSPLLLHKLAGRLDAAVTLDTTGGRQNARLDGKAEKVRSPGFSVERIDAALGVADATGHPVIDGRLELDRAALGTQTFARIEIRAKGAPPRSALSVAIRARDWSLSGAGALVADGEPHLDLASVDLRGRGHRIGLAAPATLRWRNGAVQTDRLALTLDAGRIDLSGRAGRRLDLIVSAKSVPLAGAALIAPQLGLSGVVEGQAQVSGVFPALSGGWRFKAARVSSAATRSAALPPVEATASGRFEAGGVRFTADLLAGPRSAVRVGGFAPLAGGGLDVSAKGAVDATLARSLLPDGDKITGRLAFDMQASGSMAAPRLKGSAAMTGGSFADATTGLRLAEVAAQLVARGDRVQIERVNAQTPGGGSLSATGRIELAAASGFPGELHIKADRARLLANDFGTATANLSLDVDGPLAIRPRLRGRVDVLTMELAVPERLPQALQPPPNLRLLHPGRPAAARLALAAKQAAQTSRASGFDAALDLEIFAANRIFVRGRGLDAEFAGRLRLTGTLGEPVAQGGFDLRRGVLAFLTRRLEASSGRLSFAGALVPDLALAAQASAADVTAQIAVSGPANAPVFSFSSTPAMPQDEILSRILFAKPSGGLSPLQALQLADLAGQLAGQGNGSGMFEKMRKTLGVDSLDIRTDAAGNAQVGASRYINDHLSLGVTTGANAQDSAVSLGLDITKRLRAQGELGADGRSSVGAGMEWEY